MMRFALAALSMGRSSRAARDWALRRAARKVKAPILLWDEPEEPARVEVEDELPVPDAKGLRAAE